jgi:hypothetical protein
VAPLLHFILALQILALDRASLFAIPSCLAAPLGYCLIACLDNCHPFLFVTRYRGFEVFLMLILHCLYAALHILVHIARGIGIQYGASRDGATGETVQHGVSREGTTGENVQTLKVTLRSKFRKLSRIEMR